MAIIKKNQNKLFEVLSRIIKKCVHAIEKRVVIRAVCPICHWKGYSFLDIDIGSQGKYICRNALCPRCESHPRHRLVYLYLEKYFKQFKKKHIRCLHVAPEHCLANILKDNKKIHYVSIDIKPGIAKRVENLERLSFLSERFDLIVCLHVLEHVNNDYAAMKELRRVLKNTGICIIDVPIDNNRQTTYVDPSVIDPKERVKKFWQYDHVRLYGLDFKKRLEKSGFHVNAISMNTICEGKNINRYALLDYPLHIASR